VKTLEAVIGPQQKNRICGLRESMMRERCSWRINLAPERLAECFSRSQDPKPSFDAAGQGNVIALDNIKTVYGKEQLTGAVESLIIIAASTTLSGC
jgi:hypothetical protein